MSTMALHIALIIVVSIVRVTRSMATSRSRVMNFKLRIGEEIILLWL